MNKSIMRRKKAEEKEIALRRINTLFEEARKTKEQELADRYVELARKISMKAKVRIPSELKRRFCKHCHSHFRSGNYRVRLQGRKVVYYCLKCKHYTRFPYVKRQR